MVKSGSKGAVSVGREACASIRPHDLCYDWMKDTLREGEEDEEEGGGVNLKFKDFMCRTGLSLRLELTLMTNALMKAAGSLNLYRLVTRQPPTMVAVLLAKVNCKEEGEGRDVNRTRWCLMMVS